LASALQQNFHVEHILAAVDFSEVSDAVIARAAELAKALEASLRLIHVAPPDPDFVGYDAGPQTVRDQVASSLREAHRRIQELAAGLRAQGVQAKALLIQGPVVDAILREADSTAADLLVLGSHGRGPLYRALLGSVSEGVLRKASCPVLIVPHAKR
jgi:nucleotide-binding universal stress UspA family protein